MLDGDNPLSRLSMALTFLCDLHQSKRWQWAPMQFLGSSFSLLILEMRQTSADIAG